MKKDIKTKLTKRKVYHLVGYVNANTLQDAVAVGRWPSDAKYGFVGQIIANQFNQRFVIISSEIFETNDGHYLRAALKNISDHYSSDFYFQSGAIMIHEIPLQIKEWDY